MTALRNGLKTGTQHARARSLAVLASIIGRKHGINVVFRNGCSASTDGKNIYLPVLSADASEEDAILVEGLLDHEAGHCRFTDFDFVNTPEVQAKLRTHPLIFPTWNTFEDVWMEREQSKVYPGCFRNIKKSIEVMIDRGLYAAPVNDQTTAADGMRGFLLHALLGRLYDNPRLQVFGQLHRERLAASIGEPLTEQIWQLALEVDQVKSSQACFALALRIFDLIKGELEKELDKKKKSKQKTTALEQMLNLKPKGGDIADMIQEALNANGVTGQNPNVPQLSHLVCQGALSTNLMDVPDLVTLAKPIASKLGSRLEVLLETRTQEATSFKRSGRKLASGRVVGMSLGNLSAFVSREEGDGLDTAVTILGDFSGSMYHVVKDEKLSADEKLSKSPHVVAKTSMLAIGDVLDRFEVPFSITAYGSDIREVKPFDAPWRKSKVLLNQDQLGATYTAEALLHVAQQMALRKESRRLVLLLTDGDSRVNSLVIPAMNEMANVGIEFACIFIGDSGVSLQRMMAAEGYPVQRASSIDALPQVMFEAIRNAM